MANNLITRENKMVALNGQVKDLKEMLQMTCMGLLAQHEEIEKQRCVMAQQDALIDLMEPHTMYALDVLECPDCRTMTEMAKELQMTVQELIRALREMHVIYRSPSGQLLLYARYCRQGFVKYRTHMHDGPEPYATSYMVWTEEGRRFLHRMFD